MPKVTRDEYLQLFDEDLRTKALEQAQDIRKFEIDLYWKRGSYFWAFTAVAFAGYFAVKDKTTLGPFDSYLISCLGFLFSLAWYFVNRGSTAWQQNWEMHVDMLEDSVTGPLYKTMKTRDSSNFWSLMGPFPFSPSRINNLLSMSIMLFWLLIIIDNLFSNYVICTRYRPGDHIAYDVIFASILTLVSAIAIYRCGKSRPTTQDETLDIEVRKYKT